MIIREKDIDKYYDEVEFQLMKKGSGLFPPGHTSRKDRTGNGLAGLIAQGVKIAKVIGENKENIKNVAEAASGVVNSVKNAVKTDVQPMVPNAESIDPKVFERMREAARKGEGFKYD